MELMALCPLWVEVLEPSCSSLSSNHFGYDLFEEFRFITFRSLTKIMMTSDSLKENFGNLKIRSMIGLI